MKYDSRVLVKNKAHGTLMVWVYNPEEWEPGTIYSDHFDILGFAHTMEERDAIKATVEYHTNLMKENQDANN